MGILWQLAFCNTFCRLKAAAKLASLCQTGYKVRFNVMAEHLMSDVPFWQSKTLDEMSDAEWESLCDGCGQCCLHKLMDEDTDEIYFTNVACRQLNIKTCQCRNYERRFEFEPDCIKLTRENLPTFEWLPMTWLIGCWRKVKIYLRGIRYLRVRKRQCMVNVSLCVISQ